MKKKVLIITRIIKGQNHIFEKVISQVDGIKKIGMSVDIIYVDNHFNLIYNGFIICNLFSKYGIQLFFFRKIIKHINLNTYNYIYIRNPFILNQISYIAFLKKAQVNNCTTILEIPTYPYKKELKTIFALTVYLIEKLFKHNLKKYISLIVYSGNQFKKIYDINCKQLINTVSIDNTPISNSLQTHNQLRLIGVASCNNYHGYDRLIVGLSHYYNDNNINPKIYIEFNIFGEGPESKYYLQLINKYNLNKYVKLHGKLYGKLLKSAYDNNDIGVSCLGMHRIGLSSGSPLKSSEYAVRGLPFILAYHDPSFSDKEYCLSLPNDDTPIDIDKIIKWFNSSHFCHQHIRRTTIENISWQKQFETIFNEVSALVSKENF